MKKMGAYDWEYGVVLRFYEMEQHIQLKDPECPQCQRWYLLPSHALQRDIRTHHA